MGWSHPEGKEIFDRDEFIKEFTLERVQPVGPVFDVKKLEWMNGQYILRMENSDLGFMIHEMFEDKHLDEKIVEKSIPLVRERMKTLKDYWGIAAFLFERPTKYEQDFSDPNELIQKIAESIASVSEWKAEHIGIAMQDLATKEKIPFGKFFMMLRVIISGKKISPPLNESMEILGKEECILRIKNMQ